MRIAKWDNIKFIMIYFVVLGHMISAMNNGSSLLLGLRFFVYLFHMPVFFFVAGLFSKHTVDGRRYDRVMPYLFLYLFMKIFRFLLYAVIRGKTGGIDFFSEGGVPWFGLTLFLCYLITMSVTRLNHFHILAAAVCVGIMAGYDSNLGSFLTGMRLFTFYPFFLAGYCISVEKLTAFTEKRTVKITGTMIIFAALVVSLVFEDRLNGKLSFLKGKSTYGAMKLSGMGGVYRGVYYILVLILIVSLIAVIPSVNGIFTRWGSRTVQVYAVHYPILSLLIKKFGLKTYLDALFPGRYVYLIPVMALMFTIILSARIWEPFFRWLMNPGSIRKTETHPTKEEGYLS